MGSRAADVLKLFGWALLLAATVAPRAEAQAIGVNVIEFTGRTDGNFDLMDLATTAAVPISQGECAMGEQITFRFTNVDPMRANLFFYQGANCEDVAIRNDTVDDRCQLLVGPFTIEGRTQVDVTLDVGELVPCGEGGSGTRDIFVLAVDNMMDEVSGAGQLATFPIAFDFEAPPAPSEFQATGGETFADLSWGTSTAQVIEYEVFLDPNGCVDGTVDSALLADPNAPDPNALVATTDGTASSFELPFPDSVPIGGEAAVAIRAIDRADNVSPLSSVRCVRRFEVTSWLEAFCAGDGAADACTGEGCSIAPAGGGSRLAWLLMSAVAAIALARRRLR